MKTAIHWTRRFPEECRPRVGDRVDREAGKARESVSCI